ncbi:hypothetical protein CSE45_1973 [Citreicella sp. SE45]|nr:hypothetical protein CSE45_1973 [Citreicella sp. SE45]
MDVKNRIQWGEVSDEISCMLALTCFKQGNLIQISAYMTILT